MIRAEEPEMNIIFRSPSDLRKSFRMDFREICELAANFDFEDFLSQLRAYLISHLQKPSSRFLLSLVETENTKFRDIASDKEINISTMHYLFSFLNGNDGAEAFRDGFVDLLQTMRILDKGIDLPSERIVQQWMSRWPNATDTSIFKARESNKKRIITYLADAISSGRKKSAKYHLDDDMSPEEQYRLVNKWWNDSAFHLTMAARTPTEINGLLGGTLPKEEMDIYNKAAKKGMPFFLTPYYASLLCVDGQSFDDQAIRSYVIYSKNLVETFGDIKAWEKEDIIEAGRPNAAGWILPTGGNIHRRYPDVAILIPDTSGRSCGGLCASCQRMYGFQKKQLNFEQDSLLPDKAWPSKLKELMHYFETDTQIRDILVTGGDALMSGNNSLEFILDEICNMALRKREANKARLDGDKYAEIQRIRLGSRLPVYLPMRIDDDLVRILEHIKKKGEESGISQFIVQTHFQTPLEITPESTDAVRRILSAGWRVTNQLVFNVAASRRGHAAKLRNDLAKIGVESYYTFSVKGFAENRSVFSPNSRSVQEALEEKRWLKSTDMNVLNLPAIGKSMTFDYVGLTYDGCRILRFDHDKTRALSPVIEKYGKAYVIENRSICDYLRQLKLMGENLAEYSDIWGYIKSETEKRSAAFEYPKSIFQNY